MKLKIILIIIFAGFLFSCQKNEKQETETGKIETAENNTIGGNYAELKVSFKTFGEVYNKGIDEIESAGVCYSENTPPTLNDSVHYLNVVSQYEYSVKLEDLKDATTYYWRAFIQKADITVYSEVKSFTTKKLATVATLAASTITGTSATLGGNIITIGDPAYTSKGICYATTENPATSNSTVTVTGSGTGNYTGTATGLSPNTTYYFRAYAMSSIGTAYGEQMSFTTTPELPAVTTNSASNITNTSATLGGNITNAGSPAYTERGICYSTSQNPTTDNTKVVIAGSGTGNYTTNVSGLTQNTTYYVRAYAINSAGTAYGEQMSFATTPELPAVTTNSVSNITNTSATCGGNVTANGIANITARGVCWNTAQNPTVNNNKTSDGNGNGTFTSNITGLISGQTYYVRAYATNSNGTSYGEQKTFTTTSQGCPAVIADISGNTYNTVQIGTQCWMRENLKTTKYNDGTNISHITDDYEWWFEPDENGAYCYYDNNSSNAAAYGALYNWFAVNTGKLCPSGWHVPAESEFITLITYLGNSAHIAGGKMKTTGTTYWSSPNTGASNSSNFSARGGGYRYYGFDDVKAHGIFWTSSEGTYTGYALTKACTYNNEGLYPFGWEDYDYEAYWETGVSVRCLKNSSKEDAPSNFRHPVEVNANKAKPPKEVVKPATARK